jgi:hypothetical protein
MLDFIWQVTVGLPDLRVADQSKVQVCVKIFKNEAVKKRGRF